ncbi:MAG TPA: M50 family metallopeptidase [Chloroflexaceae bacterium]|nr:M50 family metallopeptidase [Chloroflexaceae bacterium]
MSADAIIATWSRQDVLFLAGLSFFFTLLWHLPVVGLLFYPFRLLNTFVHELSHGLAAILTGGQFLRFVVHPNRDGLALTRGGSRFVVVSAGYLGPAVFGGALILLSATGLAVTTILLGLGGALALLCLGFVRNLFGFTAGLLLALGLGLAGWYLPERQATLLFALLAMQLPMDAVNSLVDLIRLSLRPARGGQLTDAQVMARDTRIPAVLWALLWLLTALAIVVLTVAVAFRDTYLF